MDSPLYLCEYLPRLGRINTVLEASNIADNLDIITDGESVFINDISLALPIAVEDQQIELKHQQNSVSFSLKAPNSIKEDEGILQDQYPWTAKEINSLKGDFKCVKCQNVVISLNRVKKVHAMPSELWSEMLEFWHCHKPQDGEQYISNKISQRFNSFQPQSMNLLVGSYYFIINPNDWQLKEDLKCQCGEILGEFDANYNNYKVFKWKLQWDQRKFDAFHFITLKLLDEINSSAVRFYILKCPNRTPMLLWCFNSGLNINISGTKYSNCLKLLYKPHLEDVEQFIADQNLVGLHRYSTLDIEWEQVYDDFRMKLQESNMKLPTSQRVFNGWDIGYLG